MKTFLITLLVGATLLPSMAQTSNPSDEATPEIGAALKDTLLDLSGSVKLMKIIEFNYVPSQRDPFISHEIISPFVTEEEVPEIEPDKQQNKLTKAEIETLVKGRIKISGVSTGNAGGGYAIASLITKDGPKTATDKSEIILKPGSTFAIPLTDEEATMIGTRLAEMAGITLSMNPGKTSILLTTQRVNERSLTPDSQDLEATPVVIFKNPVSIQGEADSELYIPYKKDWGLEAE